MKKLVLSFLMVVVLVSGIFCQTFTTVSGKVAAVETTPIITTADIANLDHKVVIYKAEVEEGDVEYIEVDGIIYVVEK